MRIAKMIVAAALMLGASAALATNVSGSLVCANDTTKGISGVVLTFTESTYVYPTAPTGADGSFAFRIYGGEGAVPGVWSVTADLSGVGGPANASLGTVTINHPVWPATITYLAPIAVDVPWCGTPPPPPPPPPACPELTQIEEVAFCPAKPLGNPRNECRYFGLEPLDKNDGTSGQTWVATTNASLALVKAGGCYIPYVDVKAGDVLASPTGQGISHVTYCTCPE